MPLRKTVRIGQYSAGTFSRILDSTPETRPNVERHRPLHHRLFQRLKSALPAPPCCKTRHGHPRKASVARLITSNSTEQSPWRHTEKLLAEERFQREALRRERHRIENSARAAAYPERRHHDQRRPATAIPPAVPAGQPMPSHRLHRKHPPSTRHPPLPEHGPTPDQHQTAHRPPPLHRTPLIQRLPPVSRPLVEHRQPAAQVIPPAVHFEDHPHPTLRTRAPVAPPVTSELNIESVIPPMGPSIVSAAPIPRHRPHPSVRRRRSITHLNLQGTAPQQGASVQPPQGAWLRPPVHPPSMHAPHVNLAPAEPPLTRSHTHPPAVRPPFSYSRTPTASSSSDVAHEEFPSGIHATPSPARGVPHCAPSLDASSAWSPREHIPAAGGPTWPPHAVPRRQLRLDLADALENPAVRGTPQMLWDISLPPVTCRRITPRGIILPVPDHYFSEYATSPSMHKLVILPDVGHIGKIWGPIVVERPRPVTVYDVYEAIYGYFQVHIPFRDVSLLSASDENAYERLVRNYRKRCRSGPGLTDYEIQRGVRRIDWLWPKRMFVGLSPVWELDGTFTLRLQTTTKGGDV